MAGEDARGLSGSYVLLSARDTVTDLFGKNACLGSCAVINNGDSDKYYFAKIITNKINTKYNFRIAFLSESLA